MIRRLASLRLWLVVAMVGAAAVGLVASRLIIGAVDRSNERAKDRRKAETLAAAVARQVARGAGPDELRQMQSVLSTDRIVVFRGGRAVFTGTLPPHGDPELTAIAPFAGGRVELRDYETPGGSSTPLAAITGVVAAAIGLVILAAAAAATLVVDTVRRPIDRAVAAARRVAAGDFGARIGGSGPEELVELGRAFDDMAARLEAADERQRRFLSDLAHELATPVNVVSGYALALAGGEIRDPEELREVAAVVHDETERLRSLLDRLRHLVRLDLAQPGPLEPVDVGDLLHRLQTRFLPAARDAGVVLRVRGGGTVDSDPRLLATILDNLVSNAIRYTPSGGTVTVASQRRRGGRALSVRDSGIGIAPEHQRRVFDRFYRVDEARDRASGGSGLGLALAQRAARALGGRLELESAPGRGTEVRLLLPTSREPAEAVSDA